MKLNDLRTDYGKYQLDEGNIPQAPDELFDQWMQAALDTNMPDANAMVLSTINPAGFPASRVVLLREFSENNYVFYTNYTSSKGKELALNPNAALLFFWPTLERQIRIIGVCKQLDPTISDAYFASRPYESQIAAWASPQSQDVPDRDSLETSVETYRERYPENVPRPPHWGGYQLQAQQYEFWQGRPSRLHDRLMFKLEPKGTWNSQRLAP